MSNSCIVLKANSRNLASASLRFIPGFMCWANCGTTAESAACWKICCWCCWRFPIVWRSESFDGDRNGFDMFCKFEGGGDSLLFFERLFRSSFDVWFSLLSSSSFSTLSSRSSSSLLFVSMNFGLNFFRLFFDTCWSNVAVLATCVISILLFFLFTLMTRNSTKFFFSRGILFSLFCKRRKKNWRMKKIFQCGDF